MNIETTKTLQAELQDIFADTYMVPETITHNDFPLILRLTGERRKDEKKIEVMRAWMKDAEARHADRQTKIDSLLERFALEYYNKTGSKTLDLPFGHRLSLRAKSDRLEILDEDIAIKWAQEYQPELVKEKYSVGVKALLNYFKTTGEVPPGTEFNKGEGLSFSCTYKGVKNG